MKSFQLWRYLSFYLIFYLIFLIVVVVGYPLAQQYAKPLAALIFPINENNSLMKNVIVLTGMYWGMIAIYLAFLKSRKS